MTAPTHAQVQTPLSQLLADLATAGSYISVFVSVDTQTRERVLEEFPAHRVDEAGGYSFARVGFGAIEVTLASAVGA